MSLLKVIITSDGSSSLLNTILNETYHSIHGAIQESNHVFIKHGLEFVQERKREISILEIGFGTGLNALLTLQHALANNLIIQYTTLEAYPIEENVWSKLNYAEAADSKEWFEKLHRAGWDEWAHILPQYKLRKLNTTLQQVILESHRYDLVYFDAFAPSKQPEMWQLPMLQKIAEAMLPGGVFVTYCAKGQLKRDLKNLNFQLETLPGPPGKREMVRAVLQAANNS